MLFTRCLTSVWKCDVQFRDIVCIHIPCEIQAATIVSFVVWVVMFIVVMVPSIVVVIIIVMGFVTDIGVEVLANAHENVFASLITALDFTVPKSLREFSW